MSLVAAMDKAANLTACLSQHTVGSIEIAAGLIVTSSERGLGYQVS